MEREVGGGIRMGNTCKPMAVSFQCMKKSNTIKKKKIKKKSSGKEWVSDREGVGWTQVIDVTHQDPA